MLVIFLLFYLPFIIYPFAANPFEPTKVLVAEITIELIILTQVLKNKNNLFKKLDFKQTFPFLILFLLSIISFSSIKNPDVLFGNPYRLQGTFLLWHLLALAIVAPLLNIKKIKTPYLVTSSALLLIFTLVLGENLNGRSVGTLGEPNALAAVAIFFWPFLLFEKNTYLKFSSVVLVISIIALTNSQAAIVAFIVQITFLTMIKVLKIKTPLALLISIFLMALSMFLPLFQKEGTLESRKEIWKTAFRAGKNHPIIGSGFGNVEKALLEASNQRGDNNIKFQFIDSSHNIFLDFWVQGGIVGFLALAFLLIKSLKNRIRLRKIQDITLLLGLITVLFFNPASVASLVALWVLIGKESDN